MDCNPPASSLSMGISRQEYWSGCHFLLQGIFLTQGLNPSLLHCRQILYHCTTKEALIFLLQVWKLRQGRMTWWLQVSQLARVNLASEPWWSVHKTPHSIASASTQVHEVLLGKKKIVKIKVSRECEMPNPTLAGHSIAARGVPACATTSRRRKAMQSWQPDLSPEEKPLWCAFRDHTKSS